MKKKIIFLISIIIAALLIRVFSVFTQAVENVYSRNIYKRISGTLNAISSIFPFSLGEVIFICLIIIALIIFVIFIIIFLKRKDKIRMIFNFVYFLVCMLIITYVIFMCVWGLNYYRKPLISYFTDSNLVIEEEVYSLAETLIKEANEFRENIKYGNVNTNYQVLNRNIDGTYGVVFKEFPFLKMRFSKTKPIIMSKLFLHFQITGIYSPFTSEANVNTLIPALSIPFTIAHEMAHQIGIAYEDEANFIAYIACFNSDNVYGKYSATFEAMLYALSALTKNNKYKTLTDNISEDVKDDIKKYYEFWQNYDGKLSKVSEKVNDTYLKANNQIHGVKSYSRVIRLLVYYRIKRTI